MSENERAYGMGWSDDDVLESLSPGYWVAGPGTSFPLVRMIVAAGGDGLVRARMGVTERG